VIHQALETVRMIPTALERLNSQTMELQFRPYGPYVDEVAERHGESAERACRVEPSVLLGGRRVVAEVRVTEAVASREVVGVRPRAAAERRVDSTQQIRLVRLVARPVDRRELPHCTRTYSKSIVKYP